MLPDVDALNFGRADLGEGDCRGLNTYSVISISMLEMPGSLFGDGSWWINTNHWQAAQRGNREGTTEREQHPHDCNSYQYKCDAAVIDMDMLTPSDNTRCATTDRWRQVNSEEPLPFLRMLFFVQTDPV